MKGCGRFRHLYKGWCGKTKSILGKSIFICEECLNNKIDNLEKRIKRLENKK